MLNITRSKTLYHLQGGYHHLVKSTGISYSNSTANYCYYSTTSNSTTSSGNGGDDKNHSYQSTLNLPKTTFSMKANASTREPQLLKDVYEIYKWQQENNNEKGDWVFHDGPPYANGDLHLGHALNKILKDITNRYKMMRGYKVNYIPGWDCHGLPIEMKAFESIKKDKSEKMTPMEIRTTAKAFAEKELKKQMDSFKSWGIMGDWNDPYKTLEPRYEVAQLESFYDMYKRGYVYRGIKPVHWSPSSKTALADAELEYNDNHVSKSIFVKFNVKTTKIQSIAQRLGKVDLVIWTTTPWTIPANMAISVNPELEYCLVENGSDGYLVVSKERLDTLRKSFNLSLNVVDTFKGDQLTDTVAVHPQYGRDSKVLMGDHVITGSGTGLVHTAPGHGIEDFDICQKYQIPVISPVDDNGRFTHEVGDKFQGLEVLGKGNLAVIEDLEKIGCILFKEDYVHKYPYDWRTKKPILIRTTKQWFVDLKDVHKRAVECVGEVNMVPPTGANRLASMVSTRSDWCISRQRVWGVPIPVFYHKTTGEALIDDDTMSHIFKLFEKSGSDCWFQLSEHELLPEKYKSQSDQYVKSMDTMDVWFDSGTSWRGVLVQRGIIPKDGMADIYLEGSDQHRGWFQSSLLTSVCVRGIQPYRNVVTHGFLLDEKGMKMSKSIGNTIAPNLIVHGGPNKNQQPAYGVDMLRMWVASSDYSRDILVGPSILQKLLENIKKLRNTVRYMLGSNFDFNPNINSIAYKDLSELDKYALHKLYHLGSNATKYYDQFQFQRVTHDLVNFANEISAFYFDTIKQRLYVESKDNILRRSSQTVLFNMLEVVNKILAPVTVHTSEDIHQHQHQYREAKESVFTQGWFNLDEQWNNPTLQDKWTKIIAVRDLCNRVLQVVREDGVIGRSDEASLKLVVSNSPVPLYDYLQSNQSQLDDIFSVSGVELIKSNQDITTLQPKESNPITKSNGVYNLEELVSEVGFIQVTVQKSSLHKCPRCWRHQSKVESHVCEACSTRLKQ